MLSPPALEMEVKDLATLTTSQLQARYALVFGESTRASHKTWLLRRIAWRLQAQVHGNLSQRAHRRAQELANDAAVRLSSPGLPRSNPKDSSAEPQQRSADHRLPPPGHLLVRVYKGKTLHVKVLAQGFEFEAERYPTLSCLARHITGSHCNGYLFFRLTHTGESS